jgi:hydrogenase maturation protease
MGNDLIADDAFGLVVAGRLTERLARAGGGPHRPVEVVTSAESGVRLLDHLLGVSRVVVIDTVQTGRAAPGTIYVLGEEDFETVPGGSPHYVGLFETLELARKLEQPAADEVTVVAVEAEDCVTVGGAMTPAVARAVDAAVEVVEGLLLSPEPL